MFSGKVKIRKFTKYNHKINNIEKLNHFFMILNKEACKKNSSINDYFAILENVSDDFVSYVRDNLEKCDAKTVLAYLVFLMRAQRWNEDNSLEKYWKEGLIYKCLDRLEDLRKNGIKKV